MDAASFVAQRIVGIVFVLAGATKVAHGDDWPHQALALGCPRALAVCVPWAEIVIGAILIVGLFEPGGAIAAGLLLVAFTVLIIAQLGRGRHPQCACFGAWSAAPLGWRHVIRNVVLIACAVFATSS